MLGKIRSSSSSLESLELERPPSKLLKDDSLSIYEATLMKLKQGSQCKLSSPSTTQLEGEKDDSRNSILISTDPMKMDTNCSVSSSEFASSPNDETMSEDTDHFLRKEHVSRGTHSASGSKEQEERSVSILYMFSKFKKAHQHAISSSMNAMENGCSVSASASFSTCGSLHSTEQSEQEYVNSLPVSNL